MDTPLPAPPPAIRPELPAPVDQPWPALPDDGAADDLGADYGTIVQRAWERQRRLDREQRGDAWNG
jgi:hypothetical protein